MVPHGLEPMPSQHGAREQNPSPKQFSKIVLMLGFEPRLTYGKCGTPTTGASVRCTEHSLLFWLFISCALQHPEAVLLHRLKRRQRLTESRLSTSYQHSAYLHKSNLLHPHLCDPFSEFPLSPRGCFCDSGVRPRHCEHMYLYLCPSQAVKTLLAQTHHRA